jgi:hypothetical protein
METLPEINHKLVKAIFYARWHDGLAVADVEEHFRYRSVAAGRCVEDVKCLVIPSAADARTLERVPALAYHSPAATGIGLRGKCFHSVQKATVAGSPCRHLLEVNLRVKPIEDVEHRFGLIVVDQIDGSRTIELRVSGIQPSPNFIRRVVLAQATHDVAEIG